MTHNRIEKRIDLKAPRSRVWRALTTPSEFGAWFGVAIEGDFVPGKVTRGRITNPEHTNVTMEIVIEAIETERLFSFHWRPYAIDPKVDYSKEPMTLVEFTLEDHDGGTRLEVTETGFDGIPEARRAEAFKMNDQGWGIQMHNIERHVAS